jgi:branched-subunit amino acid aminotransferase/4-amino-4-deoxychorismate lyase
MISGIVSFGHSEGHRSHGSEQQVRQPFADMDLFRRMARHTHGLWRGSAVFDGARAFEGVTPGLDRHCARVKQSAEYLGLKPVVDLDTWLGLAQNPR